MAGTIEQVFLKPGNYRVGGRRYTLSATDLGEYAAGTRKALKAGLHVPVLTAHTHPGDPTGAPQVSKSALDCLGWLKGVRQRQDGALVSNLDITNTDARARIKDGTVQFTSPELADNYVDGEGRSFGRVIRHFAFTPKPRHPSQGAFGVVQFSLDDLEEDAMPDDKTVDFADNDDFTDKKKLSGDEAAEAPAPAPPPQNPDLPPDNRDDQKAEAIVANLERLGVALPADYSFDAPGALDTLLAALKTAALAKDESEKKDEPEDSDMTVTEEPTPVTQFSEHDDPAVRKLFEERNTLLADQAKGALMDACVGLPPAMAKRLQETTVQFAEDGKQEAVYTATEVALLIKECIPAKILQFADDKDATEAEHPDGDKFFEQKSSPGGHVTPEEAKKIADDLDGDTWHAPSRQFKSTEPETAVAGR